MTINDDMSDFEGPDHCDGPESEGFEPGFEERSGQHVSGAKLDHDKIDMSLLELVGSALTEVARVMDYGQTKYTRGGFLDVPNAVTRYSAAMLRHYFAEQESKYDEGDPFYDTEKGLPFKGTIRHDAQVVVNAIFRLECRLRAEAMIGKILESSIQEATDDCRYKVDLISIGNPYGYTDEELIPDADSRDYFHGNDKNVVKPEECIDLPKEASDEASGD